MSEKEYKFVKVYSGAELEAVDGIYRHEVLFEADGWLAYVIGFPNEDNSDFAPDFDIRDAKVSIGRTNPWSILSNPVAWDLKILKIGDEKDNIKVMDNSGHIRSLGWLKHTIENADFAEMRQMLFGLDLAIREEYPGYCITNGAETKAD